MRNKKEAETRKKWTVMVYLSGDNDLSNECVWSLKEMFRTNPDDRIGLAVQIDPRAKTIQRFDVSTLLNKRAAKMRSSAKGKNQSQLRKKDASDRDLLEGGEGLKKGLDSMASVDTLEEFIEEAKRLHEAERYLLILSGHAGGPIGHSFLIDEFPANALSVSGVRTAIMAAGGVDVLGMDSCGMGMAEVGYQLHECADVLVASEGFEQNTGWPYFNVITAIQADPDMDARTLGAEIVSQHTEYYSDYLMSGVSTDISACDLHKSKRLARAVRRLAERLTSALPKDEVSPNGERSHRDNRTFVEDLKLPRRGVPDAVILAHWRAQSYRFERHADLYDFCDLLERGCRDDGIIEACRQLKAEIKGQKKKDGTYDGYVIKSCRSGDTFQYSNGVAIYFPWAEVDAGYDELSFATDTAWVGFLRACAEKTRRRPRDASGFGHWTPRSGEVVNPIREVPSLGIRDVPSVGVRDVPSLGVRDVPSVGIREVPSLGIRDVSSVGIRDVPSLGVRGKGLTPVVKNPPDSFYEDNC